MAFTHASLCKRGRQAVSTYDFASVWLSHVAPSNFKKKALPSLSPDQGTALFGAEFRRILKRARTIVLISRTCENLLTNPLIID